VLVAIGKEPPKETQLASLIIADSKPGLMSTLADQATGEIANRAIFSRLLLNRDMRAALNRLNII
jgi:hypothetical protein